ncbi:MAG: protoheme IX farnesyltransferase [Deltaproteobacteria bacterium]|jgi:protoheme IX farnesyltransferase|nr:protoheme IX farnesyltransferase [Deltaproteobacteria bacterium]MBW2383833.1 protoheme IX farnesyltransferase [Deltaproteobacteria bacterium]MBW2695538.1 protoheme IX farnesyltransferase [Deltaproteobacteria bacterium]
MSTAASYVALTKPRILPLVLFSGLPALVLAGGGWPTPTLTAATLLGIALCAAAANALNSYLERDLDAQMDRTRGRPLPAGRLQPASALAFGLSLAVIGTLLLWSVAGAPAAMISLAAIAIYIFAYTLWLKPRTPFAVVVGGISGAIAPLIADAAVDGHIGPAGWLLFTIIFVWQPPHFYAIALFRREDYARAGFPMLPEKIGERATHDRILIWTAVLLPLTLAPLWLPELGLIYGTSAVVLGAVVLQRALRLRTRGDLESARGLFMISLVHLLGLFAAMIVELATGPLLA